MREGGENASRQPRTPPPSPPPRSVRVPARHAINFELGVGISVGAGGSEGSPAAREGGREAAWLALLWVVRPRALLIGFEEADLPQREREREGTLMTYFTAAAAAVEVLAFLRCGCSTAAVTTKQNVLCLHQ